MKVGLSWDLDGDDAAAVWRHVTAEAEAGDGLGYDSLWIRESRDRPGSCSSPAIWLTYLARRTRTAHLRSIRLVTHANPVRVAEEVGVLDGFCRGRAGIAFAAAGPQGVPAGRVHETIDFVTHAWALDEFRYRGDFIRFPAHTSDDAPEGASTPVRTAPCVPQWEWGPVTPDFLAITPKPCAARPPVHVEITDDETLEWAAAHGVSPIVTAATPTDEAVERLIRYRAVADTHRRSRAEVEPVLERRLALDGTSDAHTLGGTPQQLVEAIRAVTSPAGVTHLVWRRGDASNGDLFRFASEVQPLLQT
jgi:alkanesulfonate monooxygenase SsuD/methylene tetrahydromethanopterin reductase-like flavin-dependent oxidoreductase (luciferase family)